MTAAVVLAGGCSLDVDPSPRATSSEPARSVTIVAPQEGATVSPPVTLDVRVSGFELVSPDDSLEPDRGHLFAFIDQAPPSEHRLLRDRPGEAILVDESAVELEDLPPGPHTVTVVAVHGYPMPFRPRVTDQVSFTVR